MYHTLQMIFFRCFHHVKSPQYIYRESGFVGVTAYRQIDYRIASFNNPEKYLIDEQWKPRPQPYASSLAPYLKEQTCREFAREGPVPVIALRFDPVEIQGDVDIALSAFEKALALPLTVPGYQWQVFHISESDRYITRHARLRLGWTPKKNKQ